MNYSLKVYTRALPCFTRVWSLFYEVTLNGIKKVIPLYIYDYLTPAALAYWIMCDGSKYGDYGLQLCTDSYKLKEVVLLLNVLVIKYGFKCSIRENAKKQFRIIIHAESMPELRRLVSPYILPPLCEAFS